MNNAEQQTTNEDRQQQPVPEHGEPIPYAGEDYIDWVIRTR